MLRQFRDAVENVFDRCGLRPGQAIVRRHLVAAGAAGATVLEVNPAWTSFVAGFPAALETGSGRWSCLLHGGYAVFMRCGGYPPGEVLAATRQFVHDVAAGDLGSLVLAPEVTFTDVAQALSGWNGGPADLTPELGGEPVVARWTKGDAEVSYSANPAIGLRVLQGDGLRLLSHDLPALTVAGALELARSADAGAEDVLLGVTALGLLGDRGRAALPGAAGRARRPRPRGRGRPGHPADRVRRDGGRRRAGGRTTRPRAGHGPGAGPAASGRRPPPGTAVLPGRAAQ